MSTTHDPKIGHELTDVQTIPHSCTRRLVCLSFFASEKNSIIYMA